MSIQAATTETATAVQQVETPLVTREELESVTVEGNEPRYVAPTLRDRIGRIWAPVMINGKGPYRLVLDTGANSSAIIPSVATSLGIRYRESPDQVQLHGVTGSAIVPIIMVDTFEVGDLLLDGTRLPVVADVFGGAQGVLGTKGLDDKRIYIDFRNDLIQIARSKGERLPAGFSRLPIKMSEGQLLTFEIRIGGVRTKAILDTGAQQTIGNNSLREALLRRAREGKDQSIVGVTLDVAHGQSIMVPPISIGEVEIHNMRVIFGDIFIFDKWNMTHDPTMLLGMDVIGTLDTLVIDYKNHELQLRTRH
ncbi:MAG TPA: aspartyl protease family protein [Steroidobacteraceae bacterium]|nr:aspartyl protease family protein [Steroidobacteraceae bacterium]